jgi:murein DD-endopeptidase MepM/ murein hydrolase activator NlpD
VSEADIVAKGQRLGTMGNVDGRYYAHLHLEVRTRIGMPIGGGYSSDTEGFVEPTEFIRSRRNINRDANHSLQGTANRRP